MSRDISKNRLYPFFKPRSRPWNVRWKFLTVVTKFVFASLTLAAILCSTLMKSRQEGFRALAECRVLLASRETASFREGTN